MLLLRCAVLCDVSGVARILCEGARNYTHGVTHRNSTKYLR